MSKKLNAEQTGESVVVAVRLPPNLLAGLDRVVEQSARPPLSSPTRSEVARGLIEMALGSLGALEAVAKPVAAPPTARTYTDEQLLARLKAFQERTGKTEREVADGAGIGKDTLNRWTNGKTKNGLKTRDKAKLIPYLDAQEGIA